MLAKAFSKPSLARSARFFLASSWPASATTFFIVSWSISACRRTSRCQPSKAILFALARASMFFRSRSTSAAKSTPGSRNWLMSLVKSKTGVSPAAPFSVGLTVVGHGGLFSWFALVRCCLCQQICCRLTRASDTDTLFSRFAVVETAPFFIGLPSSDTVAFFVRAALLGHDVFPRIARMPLELVAAIHCGLIQINRQPFTGRDGKGARCAFARR